MASASLNIRNSEEKDLAKRDFKIEKKIGEGSYGTVYLINRLHSSNKTALVCKIVNKMKASSHSLKNCIEPEIEILPKIKNPYIIKTHNIFQTETGIYIVMRHAENGDLWNYISENGVIAECQARVWFRQMASALQYLHNKNIVHGDLKCKNVLLSKNLNIKLTDFGFARFCVNAEGQKVLSEVYCGSRGYSAPEILTCVPYDPLLSDVWSLGIILYNMLNASLPFDHSNQQKLVHDQMTRNWAFKSSARNTTSNNVQLLVKHILEPDIKLRFTLDRVLTHEWVTACRSSPIRRLVPFPPVPSQQRMPRPRVIHFRKEHTCTLHDTENLTHQFNVIKFKQIGSEI